MQIFLANRPRETRSFIYLLAKEEGIGFSCVEANGLASILYLGFNQKPQRLLNELRANPC